MTGTCWRAVLLGMTVDGKKTSWGPNGPRNDARNHSDY